MLSCVQRMAKRKIVCVYARCAFIFLRRDETAITIEKFNCFPKNLVCFAQSLRNSEIQIVESQSWLENFSISMGRKAQNFSSQSKMVELKEFSGRKYSHGLKGPFSVEGWRHLVDSSPQLTTIWTRLETTATTFEHNMVTGQPAPNL